MITHKRTTLTQEGNSRGHSVIVKNKKKLNIKNKHIAVRHALQIEMFYL